MEAFSQRTLQEEEEEEEEEACLTFATWPVCTTV